jgi:hypothetical protein
MSAMVGSPSSKITKISIEDRRSPTQRTRNKSMALAKTGIRDGNAPLTERLTLHGARSPLLRHEFVASDGDSGMTINRLVQADRLAERAVARAHLPQPRADAARRAGSKAVAAHGFLNLNASILRYFAFGQRLACFSFLNASVQSS